MYVCSQDLRLDTHHNLTTSSLISFLCFSEDEPGFWYWEVLVIIKKCILTGAMSVILPGSPAQLLIGRWTVAE